MAVRTNIPSPAECGLPAQFSSWRSAQEDAIDFILSSPQRVKALCAPTGFGKSPAYVAAALLSGKPTCVVTDNRGLQDQLMSEFSSIGMVDLRGRKNYECSLKVDYSCEDGYAARCPQKGTIQCPSSQAEIAAASSPLVVTNYAKWTSSRKFGQGMAHFKQVVFDEGHEAPNALAAAMQVVLHYREIEKLGLDFPNRNDYTEDEDDSQQMVEWKEWAQDARATAELAMLAARARLQGVGDPPSSWVKEYTHLHHLTRRLVILATCRPLDWVVEHREGEQIYQFDPIRPGRYAEAALLLKIESIIVVSATLREKTMFMMGVGRESFDFKEFDSDFDPARCPVYYVPTMRVDKQAVDLSMLWLRLDQIAARRRDRKGIIQTISYDRQKAVSEHSRFAPSMFLNARGEAPTWLIDEFRNAGPGAILTSPSVSAGYDFPGQDCEWQFLCKVPFPPPSKILRARSRDDKELPYYLAMNKMVQIFGRGMRSKQDSCENFVGDDHLEWFLPRYGHLAPRSFHMFFRRVEVLPQPPPRL